MFLLYERFIWPFIADYKCYLLYSIVNLHMANPIGWLTLCSRNPSVYHRLANFWWVCLVRPTHSTSTSTTTTIITTDSKPASKVGRATKRSTQEEPPSWGNKATTWQVHTPIWFFFYRISGGMSVVWSNTLVLGTSAKELLMLIPNEAEEATRRLQTSFSSTQSQN